MNVVFRMDHEWWSTNDIRETGYPIKLTRKKFEKILEMKIGKGLYTSYAYTEDTAVRLCGYILFSDGSYLYIHEEYGNDGLDWEDIIESYYELGRYDLVSEEWD